ncbi:MAG: ATP-binding cassette domain-containing protein [Melioribacteraceae bacterium]|jgi:phospholipid/cholesterol/gamma-HCH transport system ATP-binding protein|nr:ATP-binding cassette domain-containing protein [Melioribacteraceae bacterium]WKZ70053.1 MAG: ATP-binding cassette domain-containing protein [Melioribacteraceae bacterium]
MIALKNISLTLNSKTILKNVNCEIKQGLTSVILGPSGAGKSSLLRIILGLWLPDKGSVLVDGKDITTMDDSEVLEVRKNIGIVFQSNALFDSLSVAENIVYFLPGRSEKSEKELVLKAKELLSYVNMPGTENLYPGELSGGMKKRVAIARALALRPKVILFDEPTTGLDPINSGAVLDLIDKLKQNGTTSVVVTHILNDAIQIGDRFTVINNGSIMESGSIGRIMESTNTFVREFFSQIRRENHWSAVRKNQRGMINVQ